MQRRRDVGSAPYDNHNGGTIWAARPTIILTTIRRDDLCSSATYANIENIK